MSDHAEEGTVPTADEVRNTLRGVKYPGFTRDIVSFGIVREVETRGGAVRVQIVPPTDRQDVIEAIVHEVRGTVQAMAGVSEVEVTLGESPRRGAALDHGPIAGVRDIVAVASGKGGVGKSTVSVNLAVALRGLGLRVGLLDADIYGPSVPMMLGVEGSRPRIDTDRKKVLPLERHGLSVISMGFFLDDSSPVIWRGPLVMGIIRQFLRDVEWGDQDVVVVDLPPGTGDAPLTLVQQVPLSGGVIVTTPQDVALLDVQRAVAMFRQLQVPVLGVVENMSVYECPDCGHRDRIFGQGAGTKVGERFGLRLLGSIPLVAEIRVRGDAGEPFVARHPGHPVSELFRRFARDVLAAAAGEQKRAPIPRII